MDYSLPSSSVHGDSPGLNTGVGCHALHGLFPTQGSHTSLMSPALRGRLFTTGATWDYNRVQISSVQSLSSVWLFATLWTAASQASLSISNSWSLLKLRSIELVMPSISSSVVPVSSCLQSFPVSGSFPMNQFFASDGQNIGASASASVLPMNIQDWFPLEWTGWISLQSRDSQESSPIPQFKSITSLVLSFLYSPTLTSAHNY